MADTAPSVLPSTEENSWGMLCQVRTVTQYLISFTPGAVGGGAVVLACIVTFWRPPKPPTVNPFLAAYAQPSERLLAEVVKLLQGVIGSTQSTTPQFITPAPPPFSLRASCTAASAAPSAAAWACFFTKNDQPRSTARPIIPHIAIKASVTITIACPPDVFFRALIKSSELDTLSRTRRQVERAKRNGL